MVHIPNQTFLVVLPVNTSRRALKVVDSPLSPYDDLNELIRVAIENQLLLDQRGTGVVKEQRPRRVSAMGEGEPDSVVDNRDIVDSSQAELPPESWYSGVEAGKVAAAETPVRREGSGLGPLTNRIAPLLVGARVLVASANQGETISVDELMHRASRVARHLAGVLRESDRSSGRKGAKKWSIGWPAGRDPERSLMRYRRYFLIDRQGTEVIGPMVDLGLCLIVDGMVVPTERCVAIASEPSGVFGESNVLMTDGQTSEFKEALVGIDAEREEMAEILATVSATGFTSVDGIDRSISNRNPGWSDAQTTSHRAAICGRLHQLAVLESTERDRQNGFTLTKSGSRFLQSIYDYSGGSR